MSLLTNKLTALTLVGALGVVSLGTISYASTVPTSIIPHIQEIQQSNSNMKSNSQSFFVQMMKPYVQIKNNKYTISSKIYENKNITLSEINKLKTMLNKANEIAFKTNTQSNLNLRNGTTVIVNTPNTNQQNTNEFVTVCGQTKVVYFWWGVIYI